MGFEMKFEVSEESLILARFLTEVLRSKKLT